MDIKTYLNWELEILSRAVAYPNLSSASNNIGMSQPQLSRIVKTLEEETGLKLLDRNSRRHSQWTEHGLELAAVYSKTHEDFLQAISGMRGRSLSILRVGALEGFMDLAMQCCERILPLPEIYKVELIIEDIGPLEQKFLRGELDLLYTFREPLNAKLKYSSEIGVQAMERIERKGAHSQLHVLSPFEFMASQGKSGTKGQKFFVSNSLQARRRWLESNGGQGLLPSAVVNRKQAKKAESPVILLGNSRVPESIWKKANQ